MSTNNFQSYAIAIFDIAKNKQEQEKYYSQILKLEELNNTYPDFAKILSMITVAKQDRKDLVNEVLKDTEFDKNIIFWIWTIIDNNDWSHFNYIVKECRKLHHYLFNITRVEVSAPIELNKQQLQKISDFFTKKLGTQIDLSLNVEPELIGGLKIQVNNKTYNNTIQNKLKNLKHELLSKKG